MTFFLAAALDIAGLVQVFSPYGLASACPVAPNVLLTARHVAIRERTEGYPARVSVVWSDGTGASGSAWTLDYDLRRDVAVMQTDAPLGRPYPIAQSPPAVGDKVWIAGFNFAGRLEKKVKEARIKNLIAAHVILDEPAEPGFSGSCVLNAQNEVIGIFHWSINRLGIASAVWGPWAAISWVPPVEPVP